MPEKWCPGCEQTLPVEKFPKRSGTETPRARCKACTLLARQASSPEYLRPARSDRARPAEPPGQKWCGGCQTLRPLDAFWLDARGRHGRAARCKPCEQPSNAAKMRRLRAENPERYRRLARGLRLAQRYGVSLEWVEARIAEQDGRCPTCGVEYVAAPTRRHHPAEPVLDHCHLTDRLRDVICRLCNMTLGSARDNAATLLALAAYLREHAAP